MAGSRAEKYYGKSPKIVSDETGRKIVQKAPLQKPDPKTEQQDAPQEGKKQE